MVVDEGYGGGGGVWWWMRGMVVGEECDGG